MRTTNSHQITRYVAAALVAAAVTAPAASAQQDLRMPDTRDAATRPERVQDLRSPDARDAAEGRGTASAPIVEFVEVPQPQPQPQGFDWADAGLGALGGVGVLLVGIGGTIATVRMRRRPIGSARA